MKTYSTSEVAKIVGFHPNTIRRYEEWALIPRRCASRMAIGSTLTTI